MTDQEDVEVKAVSVEAAASAEAQIQLSVWHWFSMDQAIATTMFSRRCGDLEANPPEPDEDEKARGLAWSEAAQSEHRSCAVAAVLSSVAFLEASINELYASASHDNLEVGGKLGPDERLALVGVAEMLARNGLLDRFQLTLHLAQRQPFDRGAQPYQDASLLVYLRNELVHYKPRWRVGDSQEVEEELRLMKGVASKKFSPNPFTGAGNPFFPDKCLGHGCTTWAWGAALTFADDFFSRLGVTPVYGGIRDRLTP